MANALYFGRKYRLTIGEQTFEVEDGKPAMDIKFDVTYARGQTAREGTVSILGLGHKTIHEFISLAAMARGEALSQLVPVKLDAGYFSPAGMVQIFDGFAWYASITSPPQMWLNIKVSEYNPLGGKKVKVTPFTNLAMSSILTTICDLFSDEEGVEFDWEDNTEDHVITSDKELKSIDFGDEASLSDVIAKLSSSLSDKVQFLLRSYKSDKTRIIECLDKAEDKVQPGTVKINKDSGLLSVTGVDAVSGCITTFLDGRNDDQLCHLDLKSELNQQANGKYYIVKKQHVGHFMGQEWYTRYFCSAREDD